LTFVLARAIIKPVVALADTDVKDSGCRGPGVSEQVTGGGLASTQDPPIGDDSVSTHNIAVCDVALVLRQTRAINCDAICGLLMECLQDVSFLLCLLSLAIWFLTFVYF
jgi:hypothetical protein